MGKSSRTEKKAPARGAPELLADLQIHQIELEMQNEELRKAQEELERSRAKYCDLYDFAPIGYLTFDRKGLIIEANLTVAKLLGTERSLLLRKPFILYVMPEDRDLFRSHIRAVCNSKSGDPPSRHCIEMKLTPAGGREFHAQLQSIHAEDLEGNTCVRTSLTDVTGLKFVEHALHESLDNTLRHEREISALLDASRAVLESHEFNDAAGSIVHSYRDLIGAAAGYVALLAESGTENRISHIDAGGMTCAVDTALTMPVRGLLAEAYRTGHPIYHNDFSHGEYVELLPEGHLKLESVILIPLVLEGKTIGLIGLSNKPGGFTEDDARIGKAFGEFAAIALRNCKLMESLERSEERFRNIYDQSPIGIALCDEKGTLQSLNHAALDIFGISSSDELRGFNIFEGPQVPDDIKERLGRGEGGRFEMTFDFSLVRMKRLFKTSRSGSVHFYVQITPLAHGEEETVYGYLVQLQDITSRREAEQVVKEILKELRSANRRLEDEIEERKVLEDILTSQNTELGDFATKVGHELKNNLLVVGRLMEIAEANPDFILTNSKLIARNSRRLIDFVEKILQMARAGKAIAEKEEIPLGDLARRIFEDLKPAGVGGTLQVQDSFPCIHGDPLGIEQVLSNLISNSFRHRDQKQEQVLIEMQYRLSGRNIQISLKDNGMGIDPHNVERIFEPAFTTGAETSFGFGLAIVRKIVEAHGGTVIARSAGQGKGTEFLITLPGE